MSSLLKYNQLATASTLPNHIQGSLHALELISFLRLVNVFDVSDTSSKELLRKM